MAALLTEKTLGEAAAAAGVALRTLKGWLRTPAFQEAYRAARQEVLERTVARLLAVTGQAVATLERNLSCGKPGEQTRAAVAILEHAARGVEVLDLAGQLAALRAEMEAMRHGNGNIAARGGAASENTSPDGRHDGTGEVPTGSGSPDDRGGFSDSGYLAAGAAALPFPQGAPKLLPASR